MLRSIEYSDPAQSKELVPAHRPRPRARQNDEFEDVRVTVTKTIYHEHAPNPYCSPYGKWKEVITHSGDVSRREEVECLQTHL